MTPLRSAAHNLLEVNLGLRPGDVLAMVADPGKEWLEAAIEAACRARGVGFVSTVLESEGAYELPPYALALLEDATAALITTGRSYTHTDGVRAAAKRGVRVATNSRLNEEQLASGLLVDYRDVAADARRYAAFLDGASEVLVRSGGGAELRFRIAGQRGLAETGLYTEPGMVGNLPAGEAACGIDDGTGEGVLVVDGSWPGLGLLASPLTLTFEAGRVVRVEGERAAELEAVLEEKGPRSRELAELGLGMNPAFTVQGITLLDEKVSGTVHVAVGNDVSFGGDNGVAYHADGVVLQPELYLDGVRVDLPSGPAMVGAGS